MYELIQVGEQSYYIQCPAKIGIYRVNENEVYLIDSGNDKDAGRRVRKILDENGWNLKGILNTHSHADHIGGNKFLQDRYGCKVFANGIEAAFTRAPILEPTFLFGGRPFKELKPKFLMATPSDVCELDDEDFPKEVEVIDLKGHCFEMVGYKLPDGTVFLADCISNEAILNKYSITFLSDVGDFLDTLDRVKELEGKVFVPAHAEPGEDLKELIELNRSRVYEVEERLLDICKEPMTFEEILEKVFESFGLKMTLEQYALIGSTVKSYLSWMKDNSKVEYLIEGNKILWRTL